MRETARQYGAPEAEPRAGGSHIRDLTRCIVQNDINV